MAEPYGPISTVLAGVMDVIRAFFVHGFETVWNAVTGFLPGWMRTGRDEVTEWLNWFDDGVIDGLIASFVDAELIEPGYAEKLNYLKDLPPFVRVFAVLALFGQFTGQLATLGSEAIAEGVRQNINQDVRPNIAHYNEVIQAAFIAPERTGEVRDIMTRFGLPDEVIDLLFIANYRLQDITTIRILFLRGIITEDKMYERLREHGFTDTRIGEMVRTWQAIPPPSDLLWMVGKEAFEPDTYNYIGLNDEFPEEQVQYLEAQGVSRFWAEKYWIAHWNEPSLGQGYEMFHRQDPDRPGQTIISEAELDLLFRAQEMPPFWRDKLRKIAYRPYGRIDVRRMHDVGVLSDADVVWAYKDIGYDDEHARNMAEFTILYNRQNDKDLTKTQIITSYHDDIISKEDAIQLLIDIKYRRETAEYLLAYEQFIKEKKLNEKVVKNIHDRYVHNLIIENDARDRLNALDIEARRIDILMEQWELDRFLDRERPSRADLDRFLRQGIIDEETYRNEMRAHGYGAQYVEWYLEAAQPSPEDA